MHVTLQTFVVALKNNASIISTYLLVVGVTPTDCSWNLQHQNTDGTGLMQQLCHEHAEIFQSTCLAANRCRIGNTVQL